MGWIDPIPWVADAKLLAAQLNTYVGDNLHFLKKNILLGAAVEKTIADGVFTISQSYHKIDTEIDAATDDLDNIAGGTEGRILILRAENTTRTVVLKNNANLILGGDISLDDTSKHVALICDAVGKWHLLYTAKDVTFMVNTFQYPNPTVEWRPSEFGAYLPGAQTGVVVYLPLNFLKIGDVIISYNLTGDMIVAGTTTLDCQLVQVNLADGITTTNINNGAIAPQNADGDFNVTASVDDVTVIMEKMYYLLITGTTDGADKIYVMGAEVLIRRLT